MKKRTTLNLDTELLQKAQEALGTSRTTETVHRALAEVVNRPRRQRLAMRDLPGLTPENLQRMRQIRN
jgi:Arc/MetJ family transcription regulator